MILLYFRERKAAKECLILFAACKEFPRKQCSEMKKQSANRKFATIAYRAVFKFGAKNLFAFCILLKNM